MSNIYEIKAREELAEWQYQVQKRPGLFNRLSKSLQTRLNALIPEKVHQAVTTVLKQMIRGVLFGARHTTQQAWEFGTLEMREEEALKKIKFYRGSAAVEGGLTGAAGFLVGLADFPLLLAIKIKLLFEMAAVYGFNTNDYKERVYLLHIFELAFSSDQHRINVYKKIEDWDEKSRHLPEDINQFDWRNFQQEYRDYIDLAKMAQLLPVIGAPIGFVVNARLMNKLGRTAMNAYRMRLLK